MIEETRTARQWFNMLPKDIAEKAIRNAQDFGANLDQKYSTLTWALGASFIWVDTPEGHHFWLEVTEQNK